MKTADLAKLTLEELKKRIDFCEKQKQKLINYLQSLKDKFLAKELTYQDYEKIVNAPYESKNVSEWFEYYDTYIKDCKERIKSQETRILSSRIFSAFLWSAVFISVFLALFYASPTLIGLVVQEPSSFYQNISQEFTTSQDYTLNLENPGKLASLKISGIIEGEGQVKVYLDELLILDSNKLPENQEEATETGKGVPLTGFAIEEEKKKQSISIPETEQPSETQQEPPSEEQTAEQSNQENQTSEQEQAIEQETTQENITIENNETIKEFSFVCEETCDLKGQGFQGNSFTLRIEISNAKLFLENVKYEIFEVKEAEKNVTETNITEEINITLLEAEQNITDANISDISLIQHQAIIGKPVKWTKHIKLENATTSLAVELPETAENIKFYKIINENKMELSEDKIITSEEIENDKEGKLAKFSSFAKKEKNVKKLIIEEEIQQAEIEYYTEAPQAFEENLSNGKIIIVSGPDELNYTNVLAYAGIPETLAVGKEGRIKIFWRENASFIEFNASDTNGNGLLDYVEWNVPHLSNQTFEIIIEISRAEHIDANRNFISDIYNETYQLDGIWSEPIYANEYARVTFSKNLTSKNDITLYARANKNNVQVEVYEFNSSKLIATFPEIKDEGYYKVYLTNLTGSQDIFDLKVTGNQQAYVEFDYIVDPTITVNLYDDCNGASINPLKFGNQTTSGDAGDVYATGTGYYVLDSGNDASELTLHTSGLKDNFTKFTVDAFLDEDLGDGRGWHFGIGTGTLYEQINCNTNTGYSPSSGYFVCFKGNAGGTLLVRVDSGVETVLTSNSWNVQTDKYYNFTIELNSSGVFAFVNDTLIINSTDTTYSQGYITLSTGGGTANRGNMSINNVWSYETDNPPAVTLSYPPDNYVNSTSQYVNLTLNATVTNDVLVNCSLWHNATGTWHRNQTQNITGTSNITTFNLTGLTNKTFIWNIGCRDNQNQLGFASANRTVILNWSAVDNSYPLFSNYWDNNASLVGSGMGLFNVTIQNTNGTVILEINNTNITATNLTANVYNASYNFTSNGTYAYKWHSWGNGTSHNYNVSATRSYTVNASTADITPPSITNLLPVAGTQYNVSSNITIQATITDASGISSAKANITLPNGTIQQITLTNLTENNYSGTFSNLNLKGRYNITFIANDTLGYVNSSEKTWFERIVPENKTFDIVDLNNSYLNYTSSVIGNISGILTLQLNISNYKITQIIIEGYDQSSPESVIKIQNSTNEAGFESTFLVDLSNANLTSANITINSSGYHLFKCTNFSLTSLTCNEEDYTQIRTGLVPGQLYTITLNKTDPIFGETLQGPSNSTDSYIRGGAATSNFGGATNIRVGRTTGTNSIRGIVWFNLSYIPSGATIKSANLSLYFYSIPSGDATGNRTHNIHKIQQSPARPWIELNATWNNYNSSSLWTTAGGDYEASPSANATFDSSALSSWIIFNVTSDVQNFTKNSGLNFGWLIKDVNETDTSTRRDYYSSEHSNASLLPRLEITYTTNNTKPTHDNPLLNSTMGGNTTDENLTCWPQNTFDAEGDIVKNIFNWYKNNNSIMFLNMPFESSNSTWTRDYALGNNGTPLDYNTTNYDNSGPVWSSTAGYNSTGAYVFDGVDDYIIVFNSSYLNNITSQITVTAWIKPGSSGGYIVAKNNVGFDFQYGFVAGTVMDVYLNVGGIRSSSASNSINLTSNTWQHVAFTWNGTFIKIFVNGNRSGAGSSYSTPLVVTDYPVLIGKRMPNSKYFNGTIDDVKIYNISLSDEQIKAIYENKTNMIVSQELTANDVWQCEVTPNDGTEDGITKQSNSLLVKSQEPPTVALSYPPDNYLNDTSFYVNLTFNASVSSYSELINCSLWHNATGTWHLNQTQIVTGMNNITSFNLANLNNKTFIWNIECFNLYGSNFASANRTAKLILDTIYPIFSNFWDNNASLQIVGIGLFNVTLQNTNGTVWLEINNQNYTATNLTGNIYNASLTLITGTYPYRWHAWGNGTAHNFNSSEIRSYTVNATPDDPPVVTLSYPPNNYANSTSQYVALTFNASVTDDIQLANCSLWHNYTGTWHENQTQNITGTSNTTNFTLNSLTNKTFIWTIRCYDNSSQISINLQNRTVILNWTAPPTATLVNLTLTATSLQNTTDDNLICSYALNGTATSSIISWYRNNQTQAFQIWPFEDSTASSLKDYSGNGYNAISNNGSQLIDALSPVGDRGYYFNGSTFMVMPSGNLTLGSGSLEIWLNASSVDGTTNRYVFSHAGGTDSRLYMIVYNNTIRAGFGNNNGCYANASTISANQTYLVTLLWDGYNGYIYINGTRYASCLYSWGGLSQMGPQYHLGKYIWGNQEYFGGTIHEVRVYNFTLSNEQILQNYNNGISGYNTTVKEETSSGDVWQCKVTPFSVYEAGYTQSSNNLTISANQAPQITFVSGIPNINPAEANYTTVNFNLTIYDANGFSDINASGINANFTKSGIVRQSSSCLNLANYSSNYANYSCSVNMWYFDSAGNWNISVSGKDNSGLPAVNDSTYFQYNQLIAMVISPNALTWLSLSPNAFNQTSNNDPTTINNTGNANLTIQINSTNLYGETDNSKAIYAGNISAHISSGGSPPAECSGTTLSAGEFVNITSSVLSPGNLSQGSGAGQEEIYYCIKQIGSVTAQTYSTQQAGSWTIRVVALLVAISFRRKKRKTELKVKTELKDDNLVKSLNLISKELMCEYSKEKETILKLLAEEIKKKYRLNNKEITELIEARKEIRIPLSLFEDKLGALEVLCKYMKENLGLSYHEIAQALGRDDRTIWTAYSQAIKKQKEPLKIKDTSLFVAISIFDNKELTVLESIIFYLKHKGRKYSEIAKLLNRDQRNIWTIYSRAVKKRH
jgi:hypothetical protein